MAMTNVPYQYRSAQLFW